MEDSYDWILLEFLTLRLVHTEPSAIHLLQFKFLYPDSGSPWQFLLVSLCSDKLWLPVSAFVFPIFVSAVDLGPHLSYGS